MRFCILEVASITGLRSLLSKTALKYPDYLAVICGETRYTYSQLKARSQALACALSGYLKDSNGNIAIISENCHRFLETYFAASRLGVPLVPINYRLALDDFLYILNNSRARVLVAQQKHINWIGDHRKEVPLLSNIIITEPQKASLRGPGISDYETMIDENKIKCLPEISVKDNQCAQIYYTSGTTGKPKGVVLTHKNNLEHAKGTIKELDLSSQDRWLHVSPMYHLADAWAVWSITQVGGIHVFVPSFEAESVLDSIGKNGVTLSNFIPTMLNILVNHRDVRDHDFSSLRLVLSGGAPIAREVVRKVIEIFGCGYIQTYGLTETSPFLTMSILRDDMKSLPFEDRLDVMVTTGRPFFDVNLKVVKDNGEEVEPDGKDVGEVVVSGDTVTPYYWELPGETSKRIIDGWLHTRDLAVKNRDGYITIVDRMDDMIITGGENVYSIEVEDVLYSHPSVLEAAVIGLPDPIWGERVTAVIVPKDKKRVGEKELIAFCKEKLAHFKAPKSVIFTDSLPKTGSAKISKAKLRKMHGGS